VYGSERKLRNQKERDHTYTNPSLNNERKNNESVNSVQKNPNSATSRRTSALRAHVGHGRARGRCNRLEPDRLHCNRGGRAGGGGRAAPIPGPALLWCGGGG